MKKTYITPKTEINQISLQKILTGSGVTGLMNDKLDLGYGGVDEDGSMTPSANHWNWDDDSWDKF